MQIIWHGQSCFELVFAKGKGEHITVLIDPSDESKTGLKIPKTDAQIVLLTNKTYTAADSDIKKNTGSVFIVDGPGEYEIKGVYVRGIDSNYGKPAAAKKEEELEVEEKKSSRKTAIKESDRESSTIYTIEAEDMKLCSLGNLQDAELNQSQVEKIGNIDVLMFPVGNGKDVGAKEALKIVSQIEPSIAVPMNYQIPKLKLDAGELNDFLKAAGLGAVEPLSKLTIKKKEIGLEEAKIIVLTP
ncbi:MAG: MBL fold metallo-hydrolase [Candidatus Paceibacterota bacterium]